MSELLPSRQATQIREALTGYLTTTFALSDADARSGLDAFLSQPDTGIFRGPYVRVRVPFRAAADGWRESLGWHGNITPYGHQAAAFARLSSADLGRPLDDRKGAPVKTAPLPTLVVTGTGSGKTEAFLYPILDHVLRAKTAGDTGVKALILYPMNALANDQARRLAHSITTDDALRGIRAALYTGERSTGPARVTADRLITNRETIRDEPPDILLTNYKMLDQVLLRGADQRLVAAMAQSLQYLVLDEFHTYDGAQGTDVTMLLRRLGLALRRLRPESRPLSAEAAALPLLDVTPVATSATLGDDGDPEGMLRFARTVFGREFTPDAVVTETRQSMRAWTRTALSAGEPRGGVARTLDNRLAAAIAGIGSRIDADAAIGDVKDLDAAGLAAAVLRVLFDDDEPGEGNAIDWAAVSDADLLATVASHPVTQALATRAEKAVSIDDLAAALLPAGLGAAETYESRRAVRRAFVTRVVAMLSHVRARVGRQALSVDLHLWVRELTRIDRAASGAVRFSWSDDGPADVDDDAVMFPAVYCRHCGRSGWGVELNPVGDDIVADTTGIRRNHASRDTRSRFRALLHAPVEAEQGGDPVGGLMWFDPSGGHVRAGRPDAQLAETALPVLALVGDDIDDRSRDDECPACGRADGIRFLGSAMATMLSVIITSLFGDPLLGDDEKKALVFTDSVQDAAHRAGFVQSRAHVFALRNAIRRAVGDRAVTLDEIVAGLMRDAGDSRDARYRLLAPDLADRPEFTPFWERPTQAGVPKGVRNRVEQRLRFDVAMEFGLQSRVGRTLELTGSLAAGVDIADAKAENIGRAVLRAAAPDATLEGLQPADAPAGAVVRWVRGVLERMRERGAVEHDWFTRYIDEDGRRWRVWGGRPRGKGMPAFPPGREAPGFPRVGGKAPSGDDSHRTQLDVVTSSQSWFAVWARRVLGVTAAEGAALTKALLAALEKDGLLHSRTVAGGVAVAYMIPPAQITVEPVTDADLAAGVTLLECAVCHNPVTGTRAVTDALVGGPCVSSRCPGTLQRSPGKPDNYYRRLYDEGDVRRVVAREHTSLLEPTLRLEYENGFKASSTDPSAPNVLVATPTLEMGIDIGDLSTVMLAGIPRTVASYLQRVGRAGRLTGNALSVAAVTGRGDQLPRMGDPLSVINGAVRPPATFIDAQEILHRQYVASVADRLAGTRDDGEAVHAADVLGSTEPRTFLGDLVATAETNAVAYTDAFLQALPQLQSEAADRLRRFAAPGDGAGTSPMAAAARDAVQRWTARVETLRRRRAEIADSFDELEKAVARQEPDAAASLATAKATSRLLGSQLKELEQGYWISALERFGLLPNYTLLDDSVTLDAAVSWIDPDTDQWQDEPYTFSRGAASAITELAPGSFFYAQGLEIPIDAVDLGPDREAVCDWVFCPACGYALPTDTKAVPARCPRCDAPALADGAQRMRVVELETVSAVARRDEASISDRDDDRKRTRFTVQVAADLDPAGVTRAWFDDNTRFGVTYARDLTIRWINLGRRGVGGETRSIAGRELTAPLFRVCDTCGKVDTQAGGNDRRDHRSWCPRRLEAAEHSLSIALSRTLVTQGVFLRLPQAITLGDSLAVPSLSAALLRGLRELMGGDPDHLRVIATVEPVHGSSATADSLLLHDAVPGGTGYLAELADPDGMHRLLTLAWQVVRDCPCSTEGRAACHRCLLPYAGPDTSTVSRAAAEQALRTLLAVGEDGEPRPFAVTEHDPGVSLDESVIEQLFRKRFAERAAALGASVKEHPGDWGNRVQVSFSGDGRIWMLRPQVLVGQTRPDFVLEQLGGGAAPIAVYTDGRAYHAVPAHNRLADDAAKRAALREAGYRVLAVTWDDLRDGGTPLPTWLDADRAGSVAPTYGLPLGWLSGVHDDPLTVLMQWMQQPAAQEQRRRRLADALPLMMSGPGSTTVTESAGGLASTAAAALLGDAEEASASRTWLVRHDALAVAARLGTAGHTDVAAVIDDRDEALAGDGYVTAWRLWLHMANLLGWRDDLSGVELAALSQATEPTTSTPVDYMVTDTSVELVGEWKELAEYATAGERDLITAMARLGLTLVPMMGAELADGIPVSFAWRDAHLVADVNLSDADRADLEKAGWTVVAPDASTIADALNQRS